MVVGTAATIFAVAARVVAGAVTAIAVVAVLDVVAVGVAACQRPAIDTNAVNRVWIEESVGWRRISSKKMHF